MSMSRNLKLKTLEESEMSTPRSMAYATANSLVYIGRPGRLIPRAGGRKIHPMIIAAMTPRMPLNMAIMPAPIGR